MIEISKIDNLFGRFTLFLVNTYTRNTLQDPTYRIMNFTVKIFKFCFGFSLLIALFRHQVYFCVPKNINVRTKKKTHWIKCELIKS